MADVTLNREVENPRWTCCRAAFGREPRAWEFSIWLRKRWAEFADSLGARHTPGSSRSDEAFSHNWFTNRVDSDGTHAQFDAWLEAGVRADKFPKEA